jgi:hypothetical protein
MKNSRAQNYEEVYGLKHYFDKLTKGAKMDFAVEGYSLLHKSTRHPLISTLSARGRIRRGGQHHKIHSTCNLWQL